MEPLFKTTYQRYGTQNITVALFETGPGLFKSVVTTEIPTNPQNNRVQEDEYRLVNGVPRWVTNDRVPPGDTIRELYIHETPGYNAQRTDAERRADTDVFLAQYRKDNEDRKYSPEEVAEMKAAFGPGRTVVNVVTGQKIKLPD